jgi:uncharacterized membrane protein YhaH (DUF805 family)
MTGSFDQPPIVVQARRVSFILLLCISGLVLVTVLAPLASRASGAFLIAALPPIALFGYLAIVAIWSILSPPRLEIGPAGIKQTNLWRRKSYAWADVCSFRPAIIGRRTRVVGFDFVAGPPKRRWLGGLNAAMAGVDGTFGAYGMKAAELAALLNDARGRWFEGAAAGPEGAVQFTGFAGARMNRKTFAIIMGVLFVLILPGRLITLRTSGAAPVLLFSAIWVYGRRLHDIGRSAWWMLAIYLGCGAIVAVLIVAGHTEESLAFFCGLVFQLALTIGLGVIPGDPGPNRFGPPPGQRQAATVAETFR